MMDRAGLSYRRRYNCFVQLQAALKTQARMDKQVPFPWVSAMDRFARMLNPAHPQIFKRFPLRYYWSFHQSEWATDIMFKDSATLAQIYPALVLHGITAFGS